MHRLLLATLTMGAAIASVNAGTMTQAGNARATLERAFRAAAEKMATGEFVTPFSELFDPNGVYISAEPLSRRGPGAARAWLERDSLNGRSTAR